MRLHTICISLLGLSALAAATTYNAEWGNFLYLRRDRIDSSRSLINAYEGLNLQVRKIAGTDVSAFANVIATNGFPGSDRKAIEVVHGYVDWDDIARSIDLRVGRQRVFQGIEPLYFDGLRIQSRIGDKVKIFAYGGARVPSRYLPNYVLTEVDDNTFDAGLRAQVRIARTQAGLAFHQVLSGATSTDQEASLDISQFFSAAYARGTITYNIASRSLEEFQVSGSWQPVARIDLFASVARSNETRIDSSNVFVSRVFHDYYEADASASYAFTGKLRGTLGYIARIIDSESPAHEAYCGLTHDRIGGKVTQKWGYGGTETRADAGLRLVKLWILDSRLDAGFLRFQGDAANAPVHLAWIGDLSVDAAPQTPWWNLRVGMQAMGDPLYDYDIRGYLQTQIRFSKFAR